MRNGGGAIMAIGRAGGSQRVERAILDALDSPLLHGNDINRAKRILFNIYASEQHPVLIPEMQEISEFFDQLDPDIEVIWGTSTDDSLGEDAKVIILAADMGNELSANRVEDDDQDEHYERLIGKLYQPLVKTVKKEEPLPDPPFVVETAPAEEPAVEEPAAEEAAAAEPAVEEPAAEEPAAEQPATNDAGKDIEATTTLGRWKRWLMEKVDVLTKEDN